MKVDTVFVTEQEILRRAGEVASNLITDYPLLLTQPDSFLALTVLRGAQQWATDILRALNTQDVDIPSDFLAIDSRYQNKVVGKDKIALRAGPKRKDLNGRHLLVFEDLFDEGYTIQQVIAILERYSPASIILSALCNKTAFRNTHIPQFNDRYIGFEYKGEGWLVGHGMDIRGKGRHFSHVFIEDPR